MSTRASFNNSLASFIADPASIEQIPGRRVKWAAVSDDFIVESTGKKKLPAGSIVDELEDGQIVEHGGSDATVSPEDAGATLGILLTDANEDASEEALTGYGILVGGVLYDNLLPDASGDPLSIGGTAKTALVNAGCTFKYVQHVDSRAE